MGSTSLKRKLRKDAADDKKRKLALNPQNPNASRTFISEETNKKKKKKEEEEEVKKKKKKTTKRPILSSPSPSDPSSSEEERRKKKRKKPHKDHPEVPNDVSAASEEEKRMMKKKKEKKREKKKEKKKKKPRIDRPEIPNGVALFDDLSSPEPLFSDERKKKKKKKKKKKEEEEEEEEEEREEKKKKRKLAVISPMEERRDEEKKKKKKDKKKPNKVHPKVPDGHTLSNPSPAMPPSSADGNRPQMLLEHPRNPNPRCSAPTSEERGKQKKQKPDKGRPVGPQPQPNDSGEPLSSFFDDGRIATLLEPYSKDQLIDFLCDAALADPTLAARIRAAADCDISHRNVFVRSLPWDATRENLLEVFSPFGPIEDCNVVNDKATGRCKGYGFVLYRSRAGAVEALKQPQKVIKNRVTHCYLASMRPVSHTGGPAGQHSDTAGRKIYVGNVHKDASPEKLKTLFAKFGEIEKGPTGFDMQTGKFKGYTTFVYKTQDGARKALMEPYKMFDGHQLRCQWHAQRARAKEPVPMGTTAAVASPASTLVGAAPQSVLAAIAAAAAQNLSMYCQNPAYAALFGQNPLPAATGINPAAALSTPAVALSTPAAALSSPAAALSSPALGGGLGGNSSSVGWQGTTGSQEMQFGQLSLGTPGGSQGGMSAWQGTTGSQEMQFGQLSLGTPGASQGGMSAFI